MRVTYRDGFSAFSRKFDSEIKHAARDIASDLRAASRGAAPHKKGILERGIIEKTTVSGNLIKIEVSASAVNRGFDYAKHMHNGNYLLGSQSKAKAGGRSGITGNTFAVGKGYLDRPLKKNADGYIKYLERMVRRLSND